MARLRAAGAIVVGTTTLPEQGWTAVGDSPLTGSTHTPWMHGRTSGGSSAGAGALAGAGCGPLHVGTDGAGSIRVPAAFCGAVGFKPTYGTVPYVPVPNNGSLSHAGPLTRSVADAALMLSVMGGPDPRDHTSLPTTPRSTIEEGGLRGLRIAYSPDLGHARVDPDVAAAVERSLAVLTDAGAQVELVTPEWGPSGPAMERDLWALAVLAYLPPDDATAELMDPGLVACTREYADFTTDQAIDAQRRRIAYAREVNSWFGDAGWDLLVTPSTSVTAFDVGTAAAGRLAAAPLGLARLGGVLVPVQPVARSGGQRAVRPDRRGPAGRTAARRAAPRGRPGPPGRGRVPGASALRPAPGPALTVI